MTYQATISRTGEHERDSVDPTRPNWMEIDLGALDHNFHLVQDMVGPDIRIFPCVKSAAYGFGITEIARRFIALGAEAISCGDYEDARTMREAGLTKVDVVVFGGTLPAGIPSYLQYDLIPTVHNLEIAEAVSSSASRPARIYIKVDSGRGRLGFPIRMAQETILQIARLPKVVVEGIYTHLPFTTAEDARWAQERTELFDSLIDRLRQDGLSVPVTQARSSAGVLFGIRDKCNTVAPGSMLYGKPSLAEGLADFAGFRSVLRSVRSRLIHISPDAADKTPGMFGRYAHSVSGATGVIPFGRKDGYQAARPGQAAFMIVRGVKAPVLAVSSEQTVLDLSGLADPRIGDEVTILGRGGEHEVTLADLAQWQDVILNDVVLRMRGRLAQVIDR